MAYVYKKWYYALAAFLIDGIGYLCTLPSRLTAHRHPPRNPRSILVVRLDHIGDFVTTTPLIHCLKSSFPKARITMVVNPALAELAGRDAAIDRVVPFSIGHLARPRRPISYRAIWTLAHELRREHFDLGIEPRGDLPSIILLWLSGVRYRIGYGITGGGFLLDHCGHYDRDAQVIERNLSLVRTVLGIRASDRRVYVPWHDEDRAFVDTLLTSEGIAAGKIALVHPYAGSAAKEWPSERFQELIDRLTREGWRVLLAGSGDDRPAYRHVLDLRGRITLAQLSYLSSRVALFIGLDSGPANIALAAGTPSVVIASGTSAPEIWLPSHERSRFVYYNVPCKPCGLTACPRPSHDCMRSVSVDDVLRAVKVVTA